MRGPRVEPYRDPVPVDILLVDDRIDGRLALEAVLKAPGYNLVKAASGREALSQLLNYDFAVILLDVQMPDLDGFQTAKLMKENELFKHIPIIFVTAINKEARHIGQGYESGAVDYIFKPFDPQILRSKVDVFVDLFRKNRQIKEQTRLLLQSERRIRQQKITELELANKRHYRNLADAIPHIVWKTDSDGNFEYFNRFWFEYTGLTEEENHQSSWQSALLPGDHLAFLEKWEAARARGCEVEAECRILRKKDGKYRWHLIRVVPEKGNGGIAAWLGTCTDIHDRKEAHEELELKVRERTAELSLVNRALQEESDERLKAQREILCISEREQKRIGQDLHDGLAQELVAISFLSEILRCKLKKREAEEEEDINRILELLQGAVEETRALSRGFYPIELERHGLSSAVEELAVNMEKMFPVKFECRCDPAIDTLDKPVAYHLYRITQEAIHNTVKHSKAGNVSVCIAQEHDLLTLTVSDDGAGFNPDDKKGCGMGLETMRYRARMIGATLNIESGNTEGGTRITCRACIENDTQPVNDGREPVESEKTHEKNKNTYR